MDDLRVPAGPGAPHGLRVPAAELIEQFSRASGPGGQGVNTTDSRVQLSIDLGTSSALNDAQRTRVMRRLDTRLVAGVLTIAASEHRSQHQNRAAARLRLAEILREAVVPATTRRPTRPTTGSRRRRLEQKRRRSETKQGRRRPGTSD
ncbi:alternative ribosome rescue aminoacyl-tRNA hydrolase ArfB [Microbacterium sp. Mu-80]|uniref:Alternative ribosome rescue aminoacyl-tRNA hydrolase ArfB n=1 Tax=Microbacterium bandirmense TaxID=3122050 RepID=A0ABU8L8G5_9MICO